MNLTKNHGKLHSYSYWIKRKKSRISRKKFSRFLFAIPSFFGKPPRFLDRPERQTCEEDFPPPSFPDFRRKTTSASAPGHRLQSHGQHGQRCTGFLKNIKITPLAILLVTFSGWLSDPCKWLSQVISK